MRDYEIGETNLLISHSLRFVQAIEAPRLNMGIEEEYHI